MTHRIGFNLLWLVPGVVGGSETSTVTTLTALAADRPEDLDHVLYVLAPFVEAHPELAAAFETHVLPLSGRVKGARVLAEQSWLVARSRRDRIDVMHHLGGTVPLTGGPEPLVSIHDLQPFDHPENFHRAKRAWLSLAVPRAVRSAHLVLTPSEWVRGTVLDRFGADPQRVRSVPHGMPPMEGGTPFEVLRRRYDLSGEIVLYPTITYPHKDHVTLVEAFAAVARRHPSSLLVLPGGEAGAEPEVREAIARSGVAARIRRLGAIPRPDVLGLVAAATVVAVPSRYEGFGIPALEAMAHGRPVVATDATALPEVVGEAGLLVPAGDVHGWAEAVSSLLADETRREQLGRAGVQRAQAFSPERNLEGTLDAQRAVLDRRRSGPAIERSRRQG